MILTVDSVAYSRLKKFAYGSIANFFILRICLDYTAILILEIGWVCFCGVVVFVVILAAFEVAELGCFFWLDIRSFSER